MCHKESQFPPLNPSRQTLPPDKSFVPQTEQGPKLTLLDASIALAQPAFYLFKVNNRNTRTRCEICSKLTINTPERRHWRRSGVFIVNFEHISHLVLVFLLLTLSR